MRSIFLLLVSGACLASPAPSAIAVALGADQRSATWTGLNAANYPGYGSFPGAGSWPAAIPANAGSTAVASFTKVSGFGYPASASIYLGGDGVFQVSSGPSSIADLQSLVFQIDSARATEAPLSATLSWNGGAQALAATFYSETAGNYDLMGASTNYAFQWDLAGIAEPISSVAITWTQPAHGAISELNLAYSGQGQSASLIGSVPEPGLLGLAALGLLGLARRRRCPFVLPTRFNAGGGAGPVRRRAVEVGSGTPIASSTSCGRRASLGFSDEAKEGETAVPEPSRTSAD